jgi:hypothetical protein
MKYLYFLKPIGMDGPIKIGCAKVPEVRMRTFAVWSPFPLELIGKVPGIGTDERFLHRCFADSHTHFEWFLYTPELARAIAQILEAGTVDVVRDRLIPLRDIRKFRHPWKGTVAP